jgi:hypothetical protein
MTAEEFALKRLEGIANAFMRGKGRVTLQAAVDHFIHDTA